MASKVRNISRTSDVNDTNPANRDPISGAPGAHPAGVGAGALAGGAAGGAIGALGGPVGAAVGVGVGAIAGGLAGKAVAENIDPTVEEAYWRENYRTRPYVKQGDDYDRYRDAYRFGWESASRYECRDLDEIDSDLSREWENRRGSSKMTWMQARGPATDAWNRVRSCGCG